jgi:hypothetical protein
VQLFDFGEEDGPTGAGSIALIWSNVLLVPALGELAKRSILCVGAPAGPLSAAVTVDKCKLVPDLAEHQSIFIIGGIRGGRNRLSHSNSLLHNQIEH